MRGRELIRRRDGIESAGLAPVAVVDDGEDDRVVDDVQELFQLAVALHHQAGAPDRRTPHSATRGKRTSRGTWTDRKPAFVFSENVLVPAYFKTDVRGTRQTVSALWQSLPGDGQLGTLGVCCYATDGTAQSKAGRLTW